MWIVREAVLSDLEAMTRLDRESQAIPWPQQALKDCITGNNGAVSLVVCRRQGPVTAAGFAIGRFLQDEFEVLTIAVVASKRNRGLGRLLMEGLRERARMAGCTAWILEVRESNQAARHLYGSLGLIETGRRPSYYADNGEAAILMSGSLVDKLGE